MKLSLLVSTYNAPGPLRQVLEALLQQTSLPDEVVICDDGSGIETIDTIAMLARSYPVPLIHAWIEDRGYRLCRSRNNGLLAASGDYLVFTDGDTVPHPRFIEDHRASVCPNSLIAADRAHVRESYTEGFSPKFWSVLYSYGKGRLHKRRNALRNPFEKPICHTRETIDPDWALQNIIGANMACWRKDALAVNGFHEGPKCWGPDDNEFASRLLNSGVSLHKHSRRAITYHLDHHSDISNESPWFALVHENYKSGKTRTEKGLNLLNGPQLARLSRFGAKEK